MRLNLNESSFGPSPRAVQAIQRALAEVPRYVTADQAQALRAQIGRIEGVAPEQVLVGEVLEALGQHLAIGGGGGEFVYSVPGYGALVDAAAPFGGRAVEVPLDARLHNDLPGLAAAVGPRTRALFVVNPHNPSGTLSEGGAFDAFLREVSRRTLAIVDEAYLDYRDDAARLTAARLLREGANVVVFRTFGKIHGLAGLQIGYAIAPLPLARELAARGVGSAHGLNQLSVAAAVASLEDTAHVAAVRQAVAAERRQWLALLGRLRLRHAEPAGNFVFFDGGRPHAELAAKLLERGVRVARAFPPYATWLRITIGRPEENAVARRALVEVLAPAG
ncbi:aspartate aminotransferase [Pseudoxanthomonas suwonensis]|uniref:Aspartate aminotransferase n=1 Tax=Pseudoxanthomonas suwonensis TaxID=314722 RepID=A0A0E3Z3Q1_9GAMM|nr:aspartate aminotransferase [Pseudoxanthomonas suwonensis]